MDAGRHAPLGLVETHNVLRLKAGALTSARMSALYDEGAVAVVAPSHYEGIGMPLLNALAARRPGGVRPLAA